jgi:hypothetical protein
MKLGLRKEDSKARLGQNLKGEIFQVGLEEM